MRDNENKFMTISIWCVAVLLLIRLFITGAEIKTMLESKSMSDLVYTLFGYIGEAIGAASIIMAVFNKYAWKWKCFRFIHNIPVLSNVYEGVFISDYDHKERTGKIMIDQTFLKVSVQLKTAESWSGSITASFSEIQGVLYLIYTYHNQPHAEIQDRSPIHYGTAMLNVSNPDFIEGNYYTGRGTKGSMAFEPEKCYR